MKLPKLFHSHPEVAEAKYLLRVVGDTLLDFNLYSDKAFFLGRYQFPLKLASSPIIVGGMLKIQLNTALLPKAVGREDLEDERLIAALRSRTGRNVESRCFDRFILPSLISEKPTSGGRGLFSRSAPSSFDFWFLVELDSAYLRGIPRDLQLEVLPAPDPDHAISWPFGQVSGSDYRFVDFPREAISMLVAGATRQGKSTYLRACLFYLAQHYTNQFSAILCDFKRAQVDFKMFAGDSRFTVINSAQRLIDTVDAEDARRAAILNASDSLTIFDYNASHPDNPFPYTFVVIDEFAALRLSLSTGGKKRDGEELFDRLMVLVATTAASGLYWILGTQRPGVDVVPGTLKTNIVTRVCFSMPTAVDGEVVFGDKMLGEYVVSLGCPGRGFCSISDSFFEFQAPYADLRPKRPGEQHLIIRDLEKVSISNYSNGVGTRGGGVIPPCYVHFLRLIMYRLYEGEVNCVVLCFGFYRSSYLFLFSTFVYCAR